jgi:hypothetical protein
MFGISLRKGNRGNRAVLAVLDNKESMYQIYCQAWDRAVMYNLHTQDSDILFDVALTAKAGDFCNDWKRIKSLVKKQNVAFKNNQAQYITDVWTIVQRYVTDYEESNS